MYFRLAPTKKLNYNFLDKENDITNRNIVTAFNFLHAPTIEFVVHPDMHVCDEGLNYEEKGQLKPLLYKSCVSLPPIYKNISSLPKSDIFKAGFANVMISLFYFATAPTGKCQPTVKGSKNAPKSPIFPRSLSLLAHYIQLWLHISGIYVGEEGGTAN